MAARREDDEFDLGEGLSDVPLRYHLIPTIKRWNDDGTRNDLEDKKTQTSEESDSSSQTSELHRKPSPALTLSREQTKSTSPSTEEVDDEESSSLNATCGGNGTVRSTDGDEEHYIWYGNKSTQFSPLKTAFPARNRGHSRAASENSDFCHDHNRKATTVPVPTSTARVVLISILAVLSCISLYLATNTFIDARNGHATLKETKFSLLLATHAVAICVSLSAIVVRRPPSEAILAFVAIVLLGNMMRREVECLL